MVASQSDIDSTRPAPARPTRAPQDGGGEAPPDVERAEQPGKGGWGKLFKSFRNAHLPGWERVVRERNAVICGGPGERR